MQLTELLDLHEASVTTGEGIPCRENDAELWFGSGGLAAGTRKAADPGVGIRGLEVTCRAVRQVVPRGVDTRLP